MTETPKSIAFHSFNEKDVNFCNLGEKKKQKKIATNNIYSLKATFSSTGLWKKS